MTLANRHEILFLYDASWVNPNGDPLEENKPRYDEISGINLVSDVRLKRTIRDELIRIGQEENKGDWVFVRAVRGEDGNLLYKDERLKLLGLSTEQKEEILDTFIDIRLFGATIAIKKSSSKRTSKGSSNESFSTVTWTGPVQFKMGYSLHPVEIVYLRGTTVMPSGEGKRQGTMRSEYVVRYSLISFYGIANENAAKETKLTEEDLDYMFRAMWFGTKNLITRSKVGQMPRLLIDVEWSGSGWHLGELDKYIKVKGDKTSSDLSELDVDLSELVSIIEAHRDRLIRVRYSIDSRFKSLFGDPFEGKDYAERFQWSE